VHLPLTPSTFYDLLGFFRFAFNAFSRFAPLRLKKKKIDNNRFNPGEPVKSFFNLEWIMEENKKLVSNQLIELSQNINYISFSTGRLSLFIYFFYLHTTTTRTDLFR
jgi:hypothetical protein